MSSHVRVIKGGIGEKNIFIANIYKISYVSRDHKGD